MKQSEARKKRFCKNRAAAQNCAIKGFGKFPTSKETAGFRESGDRWFSACVYTQALLAGYSDTQKLQFDSVNISRNPLKIMPVCAILLLV